MHPYDLYHIHIMSFSSYDRNKLNSLLLPTRLHSLVGRAVVQVEPWVLHNYEDHFHLYYLSTVHPYDYPGYQSLQSFTRLRRFVGPVSKRVKLWRLWYPGYHMIYIIYKSITILLLNFIKIFFIEWGAGCFCLFCLEIDQRLRYRQNKLCHL